MSRTRQSLLRRTLACVCLGSVILTTASCGMFKGIEDPTEGWTADKLYVEARDNLNEGNYETARDYYQKLEARYPYGRYSQQAMVEVAYSTDSIRSIRSHPTRYTSRVLPRLTKTQAG